MNYHARYQRLRAAMQQGGALHYLRRMARALAVVGDDGTDIGPRSWALTNWHLWGEVATALDDLNRLIDTIECSRGLGEKTIPMPEDS